VVFIKLSIIVPVYNEEKRISPFLEELCDFAKNKKDMEIIFVDDGSSDNSLEVLKNFKKRESKSRIISYEKNRGKGYAVRLGVLSSKGEKVIFIDADNSTRPKEIPKMVELLDKYDVVVGYREHKESKVQVVKKRKFIGKIFNLIVRILFQSKFKDNLCGFKGFGRDVAKKLFGGLLSERWEFDVELFYKIKKSGYSISTQPIEWKHKEGSKIKATDPLKIFLRLIILRIRLMTSSRLKSGADGLKPVGFLRKA